ncbi:MAG TPA: RNA-binding cell elongation regulator Jag/EloR [Spirochaetota bacterium]|nr:RNA-binding cell elongation regulator Jag/EloR [Spirochaetota bacterium]
MPSKEYEGKNEKDLISEAAREIGISESKLTIEVIEKSKGGFLGLGEKVRIRVTYDLDDLETEQESCALETYEKVTVDFLAGMFDSMGFDVDIEVDNNGTDRVYIELFSPDSAMIIGKRGKTLESIQMLVNTVGARVPGSANYKCVIDIENYREKRESTLTELAQRVAQEVIRSGKPKTLEPMNPFERRLIHVALQNEKSVETRSEGEGVHRKVRILPKKGL